MSHCAFRQEVSVFEGVELPYDTPYWQDDNVGSVKVILNEESVAIQVDIYVRVCELEQINAVYSIPWWMIPKNERIAHMNTQLLDAADNKGGFIGPYSYKICCRNTDIIITADMDPAVIR